MKAEKMKKALKRIAMAGLILAMLLSSFPLGGSLLVAQAAEAPGGTLTTDEKNLDEARGFGFDARQPGKTDVQGNPVDKTQDNPLGAPATSINRILNLSVSGYQLWGVKGGLTSFVGTNVTDFMIKPGYVVPGNASARESDYNNDPKAMTAADLNADGRNEVVTLVLSPTGANKCIPFIIVRNYDISDKKNCYGSAETSYKLDGEIPMPASTMNSGVEYPIGIVSGDFDHDGKDELAANIGNVTYTLDSDDHFNLKQISKLNCGYLISGKWYGDITLDAKDTNNDGFQELLITRSFHEKNMGTFESALLIFNTPDLKYPHQEIPLAFKAPDGTNTYFTTPSVDVGDVFGDGNKNVVIGGKAANEKIYVAASSYDPATKTYSSLSDSCYEIGFAGKGVGHNPSNMWGVQNRASLSLKCVSLTAHTQGEPQWIVLGGTLYHFNKENMQFEKKAVQSKQYSQLTGGAFARSPGNSDGLLDINCDGDGIGKDGFSFILNTVVGNFDSNKEGKEQIIMLHYDDIDGSGNQRVVITYCGIGKDGTIFTQSSSIRAVNTPYQYPAICAPDLYGNSVRLIFQPEKSSFVFSKPNVIAVLGAAPYYREVAERNGDYSGVLSGMSTSLGNSSESGSSTSNGVTVNVGVSFGFNQEQSLFGVVKIAEEEFKMTLSYDFTSTWTSSKSISKGITYRNLMSMDSTDSVVVMMVPQDVFSYKVIGPDGDISEMTINVPYEPMTVQMPVSQYNDIISKNNIQGAPLIGPEVLNHTPGDPRTYPRAMRDIKGAEAGALVSSSKAVDWGTSAMSEMSIGVSVSQEREFEHNVGVTFEVNANVMGILAGSSLGAGYVRSEAKFTSHSTEVGGSVCGLPAGYEKYGFDWQLAFYNYKLEVPGSPEPQTCYVVSYLVNPHGSGYPPYIPQNLAASSQGQNSVLLTWSKVDNGSGYRVSRSDSENGKFVRIGQDVVGNLATSYTDTTAETGKTYYYKVRAYNASDGLDCDAVSGFSLPVSGIAVATPPKLSYNPGDQLDLSALTANLFFSDQSTKTVALKDFAANHLSVSLDDGTLLGAAHDGKDIIVTYSLPGNNRFVTDSAGHLSVNLVKEVNLDTLPKLYYDAGDTLDLSQLSVTLVYNNNTSKDVAFRDFDANQLTVHTGSLKAGKELGTSDSGSPITVEYNGVTVTGQPIAADIGKLTIYEKGTSGVLLSADFTVGGQKNAQKLSPNQKLTANIKISNTQEETQDALVLLALYDEAGSMVQVTSGTVKLGARSGEDATKSLSLSLSLPKDTKDGYKVRIFAWDGASLSATKQVPLSNILQMP